LTQGIEAPLWCPQIAGLTPGFFALGVGDSEHPSTIIMEHPSLMIIEDKVDELFSHQRDAHGYPVNCEAHKKIPLWVWNPERGIQSRGLACAEYLE